MVIHQRPGLAVTVAAVLTCLTGCGAVVPSAPPAGSSPTGSASRFLCSEAEVRGIVNRFLAAFDSGDVGQLNNLVSTSGFVWWSTDAPGERIDPEARDRSTLMAYFARRHLQQDRLVLESFKFNGMSAGFGNFEYTLIRSANDGLPRTPYVGKGAIDCLNTPHAVGVWSMARNPHL
jgi:hypothetical protein